MNTRLRRGILGVVTVCLLCALFARLYFLQVLDSPTFEAQAVQNQLREVRLEPVRGRILDRNGLVLAANRPVGQVQLDRDIVRGLDSDERRRLFASLATELGMGVDEVEERWLDPANHPLLPVVVASDVEEAQIVALLERNDRFPGVIAGIVQERVYPFGPLAAHVLGYVGEIPADELESRAEDGYVPGDAFGKDGVERIFEGDLRGEPGVLTYEVDRLGRVVRERDELSRPASAGHDVYLSLDARLQQQVERALIDGLRTARKQISDDSGALFPAPSGAAVVLDIVEGSVLAMASYPDYNPNSFIGGIDQQTWSRLTDPAAMSPLTNRAIAGLYPPGSVFKVVTAIAGVRTGVINLGTVIDDQGFYRVADCEGERCEYQNAGRTVLFRVDLPDSIARSSDVFYYKIGNDIQQDLPRPDEDPERNDEAIQQTAREFGFGSPTGIQLPDERAGRVPDRELKAALSEANPEAFPDAVWLRGDNIILAIGQGDMLATPIQLANSYATLADGGQPFQPNIVTRVIDAEGELVRRLERRELEPIELFGTYDTLMNGLIGAIDYGTARTAFSGYGRDTLRVAGKTGTSQATGISPATGREREDNSLFVGVAPAFDPRYVVAVVMEEAGFGSRAAAPVARVIFEALSDTDGLVAPEPVLDAEGRPLDDPSTDAPDRVDADDQEDLGAQTDAEESLDR